MFWRVIEKLKIKKAIIILIYMLFVGVPIIGSETFDIKEELKKKIDQLIVDEILIVENISIYSYKAISEFYFMNNFKFIWNKEKTKELITILKSADNEGLNPNDYHYNIIVELSVKEKLSENEIINFELICSDAFLLYGSHLLIGKVNPESIGAEWYSNRRKENMVEILEKALKTGEDARYLNRLIPSYMEYTYLKKELKKLKENLNIDRKINIKLNKLLKKGMIENQNIIIKERLNLESKTEIFDEEMEFAVMEFQKKRGLKPDGIIGENTVCELNKNDFDKIKQIEVNMERWRWLPENFGKKYIVVNIANFELEIFENGNKILDSKVIVGKDYRKTPVFSGLIRNVTINPYWTVPQQIAVKDKLPLIKKDFNYLQKNKFKLYKGWGINSEEIDPGSINWNLINKNNFGYRLVQTPGECNALGRIKIIFPNRFDVYIHDTFSKELFNENIRSFSSGCIRTEKILEVANYVLKNTNQWNIDKIRNEFLSNKEKNISINENINVHIVYFTSWVDKNGDIYFRNDIYSRDDNVYKALKEVK